MGNIESFAEGNSESGIGTRRIKINSGCFIRGEIMLSLQQKAKVN